MASLASWRRASGRRTEAVDVLRRGRLEGKRDVAQRVPEVLPKAVSDDVVCTPGARPQGCPSQLPATARASHRSTLQPHRGCVPTVVLPWLEARGMRVRKRQLLGGNQPAPVALPSANNSTGARESADAALNEAQTVAACSCATQERATPAVRSPHLV